MPTPINHFINGAYIEGRGRTAPVFNPATGEQSGAVPLAARAEVDEAAAAAKRAFPAWAATPPLRRARILNRFLRLLEENIDQLAAVITAEHGKVLSDAKGEIQRGMEVVEFAVGAPQLLKGESPRMSARGWIAIRCASRSASSPASRHSTFPPWCQCGCSRSRSPAAIASS